MVLFYERYSNLRIHNPLETLPIPLSSKNFIARGRIKYYDECLKQLIISNIMNEKKKNELIQLVDKHSKEEGLNESTIPNLSFFKVTKINTPLPAVYNPSLCIIVQGSKDVLLGKHLYHYSTGEYLVASVDLPVIGKIIGAKKSTPYLVIKIDIEIRLLSELLLHTEHSITINNKPESGLFIEKVDRHLEESVLRLIRLLETPKDIPVLSQQMIREIYYRMLCGEHSDMIAKIAIKGSHTQRISNVIQKLKRDFHQSITMNELADIAGMSVSSFHAHFKSLTTMSPLQFQKSLRLMEARCMMMTKDIDVSSTAYQVGYESSSQFNREYTRMFGNPPRRDISLLKNQITS